MTGQTCPRRMTDFGPWEREEGLDGFKPGGGIIGQGRGCTFCGSMHPDDFMEAVREGAEIGPTDKRYKAYVEGYRKNGSNGGKFYFAHLSPKQGDEFLKLLRDDKVRVGYPGYFYNGFAIPHTATGCEGKCPSHAQEKETSQ